MAGPVAALIALLFAGVMFIVCMIVIVAIYVYAALAVKTIAKKTKTEPAWLAWIPVANIYLVLKIAKMSPWWLIAFFVPFLNIVISIIAMWKVCEVRHKAGAWSLLFLVPVANLIMLGWLAWSK